MEILAVGKFGSCRACGKSLLLFLLIWWCITRTMGTMGYGISSLEAGSLHHHLRGGAGGFAATAGMKSMKEVMQQLILVVARLEGGERPEDEVLRFVTQLAGMVSQWQASTPRRNELKEGLQKIINEVGKTPWSQHVAETRQSF